MLCQILISLSTFVFAAAAAKPNILLILADDQDHRLHSLSHQPIVQDLLVNKGTLFTNHFTTTSNCCPSRASLLRGQASHNTNITHVRAPGGGYLKWLIGEEDKSYLPWWLGKAGYKTEYIGKLMNGQNLYNYKIKPKGWSHVDILLEPYTYIYNTVVMSANGEKPTYYDGWHQTDVIRTKALARLQELTAGEEPWFLGIAPTSPHVEGGHPPIPLERHKTDFDHLTVPKPDNFNPKSDRLQSNKPSYIKNLKTLTDDEVDKATFHYKSRIRAIQGLDEIVHDVVELLKQKGQLENTYIVYTSDNGYHIGTHRLFAGKSLPYIEDTNIPLIVRGPGVPAGATSKIASTHIDFAPTFLDIAQVAEADRPVWFDGRSMLGEWKHADSEVAAKGVDREIINVEFWGHLGNEITGGSYANNSYKTMRIVSEDSAWLYSQWCTGDTELYDTKTDPYELVNLAQKPIKFENQQMLNRLNALLLVTKSCVGPTCRNPWPVLKPANDSLPPAQNLAEAMDPTYNDFFASFPAVQFKECRDVQLTSNEGPFYPPEAEHKLGLEHRKPTGDYDKGLNGKDCKHDTLKPNGHFGTGAQRGATLADINRDARKLTNKELPGDRCHQIGAPTS